MKKENKYFYIVLAVTISVLTITTFIGIKQVSHRKEAYNIANSAIANIKNKTELEKSIKDLDKLEKQYGDIYDIHLNKADAYFAMNNYEKSAQELKECFRIEPKAQENPMMLYLYAKVEYLNGNLDKAKSAIEKSKEFGLLEKDITKEDLKFIEEVTKE